MSTAPTAARRHRLVRLPVLGGLAAILVMATAVSNAAATPSPSPNACELLLPGELQNAFGGSVGSGDLTAAPDGRETICQWIVTSSKGDQYSVQLDLKSPYTKADFTQQRAVAQGPTKVIKHLGDGAFSERVKQAGTVFDDLWTRHGTLAFRLEVLKDLGSKPLESLARIVIGKL